MSKGQRRPKGPDTSPPTGTTPPSITYPRRHNVARLLSLLGIPLPIIRAKARQPLSPSLIPFSPLTVTLIPSRSGLGRSEIKFLVCVWAFVVNFRRTVTGLLVAVFGPFVPILRPQPSPSLAVIIVSFLVRILFVRRPVMIQLHRRVDPREKNF